MLGFHEYSPPPHQIRGTVHRSLTLLDSLITLGEEKVKAFCDSSSPELFEAAKTLMKDHSATTQQRRDFVGAMLADPNHLLHHYGKPLTTLLVWSDYPHS